MKKRIFLSDPYTVFFFCLSPSCCRQPQAQNKKRKIGRGFSPFATKPSTEGRAMIFFPWLTFPCFGYVCGVRAVCLVCHAVCVVCMRMRMRGVMCGVHAWCVCEVCMRVNACECVETWANLIFSHSLRWNMARNALSR